MKTNKRSEDRDFSPRLLAVVERPTPPMPRFMLYVLLLLFFSLLAWAFIGELDIVVRADGKLVPQTRIKIVQPFEGGQVSEIFVKDGDLVKAGQVLLLMDNQISEADTQKLSMELETLRYQLRRIEAELSGSELAVMPGDSSGLFSKVQEQYLANRESYRHSLREQEAVLDRIQNDLASAWEIYDKLGETLPIIQASEQAYTELGKGGYANELAILDKQRDRIEAQKDLRAQSFAIQSLNAKIKETQEKVSQIKSGYRQKLIDEQVGLQKKIAQLEQDWEKQRYRNELMELKAPQDGYVKDLATHTRGSVVLAGTVLLTVVPVDEPLHAEVFLNNKDVGFISHGQNAKIKLLSYEFQKYGMIDGLVETVAADSSGNNQPTDAAQAKENIPSGYRTLLQLDKQFLERNDERFFLRTGMQVTAEINIGSRTVVDYVLSPIQRAVHEAATER